MNEAGKINDEPSLKLFAQKKHSVAVQQLSTVNSQLSTCQKSSQRFTADTFSRLTMTSVSG